MACAEFEHHLIEYAELAGEARARVDQHVAQCAGCRELLAALEAVDAALDAQFAGRKVSAAFAPEVRRRAGHEASVRRPSWVPELLDAAGWVAIASLTGLLAWRASQLLPVSSIQALFTFDAVWAAGAAFLITAFFIGLRSLFDLKN